jgi:TPR repeat protein
MLRALPILAVPCAMLLASVPPVGRNQFQGAQDQIDLADIPIGRDTARSASSELAMLRENAEHGDLNAQAKLGVMYYWGQGAPQDWVEAQVWLRKASERGHMDAQAKLGAMCFLGQGGPRNLAESIKWFRLAADQGEPYAQGCMGVMYAVGEGVPRDLVQAYVWLVQAQAGGDADAAEPFEQVRRHLTPEQLKEAERLVTQALKNRVAN